VHTIIEMIARGWENFLTRPEGPINFRFLIQPTLASIIAIRAGLKDAKMGRPPYLWDALTNSAYRGELLRGGWKDMRTPFLIAATLDAVYQTIEHQAIYLFELLFTATLLALVPYVILRGPVNRIARLFSGGVSIAAPDKSSDGAAKK
jgi:hypothetical protein